MKGTSRKSFFTSLTHRFLNRFSRKINDSSLPERAPSAADSKKAPITAQ